MKSKSSKQINQLSDAMNHSNQNQNSKENSFSGGVQTHESLNVNTLLKQSIKECNLNGLSEQSYLNCFYTNATSLNNKFDEFIEEIHNNKAQVIMICETWWNDQSVTNIEGFNLFRKDREYSRGGGVCIYVES